MSAIQILLGQGGGGGGLPVGSFFTFVNSLTGNSVYTSQPTVTSSGATFSVNYSAQQTSVFTVGATNTFEIELGAGCQSSNANVRSGLVIARYRFVAGQQVFIVLGNRRASGAYGDGGSYIYLPGSIPIMCAGGAGGGGNGNANGYSNTTASSANAASFAGNPGSNSNGNTGPNSYAGGGGSNGGGGGAGAASDNSPSGSSGGNAANGGDATGSSGNAGAGGAGFAYRGGNTAGSANVGGRPLNSDVGGTVGGGGAGSSGGGGGGGYGGGGGGGWEGDWSTSGGGGGSNYYNTSRSEYVSLVSNAASVSTGTNAYVKFTVVA